MPPVPTTRESGIDRARPALDGELLPPLIGGRRHLSDKEAAELGGRIRAEHEAGERSLKDAVRSFRRCGDMLNAAKAELSHGHFQYVLKTSIKIHPRTAQRYMMLARELAKLSAAEATRVSHLSLRDAIGELSRLSNTANKIGGPALGKALAEARNRPIKAAVTHQRNLMVRPVADAGPAEWKSVDLPARPMPRPPSALVYALLDLLQNFALDEPDFGTNDALEALNAVYCRLQEVGDDLLRPPGLGDEALALPVAGEA